MIKQTCLFLLILCVISGAVCSAAEDIIVSIVCDKKNITLGEEVVCSLKLRYGTDIEFIQAIGIEVNESIEIKSGKILPKPSMLKDGMREAVCKYTLTSFLIGKHELLFTPIKYRKISTGKVKTFNVKPKHIIVVSVAPASDEFKSIKNIKGVLSLRGDNNVIPPFHIFLIILIILGVGWKAFSIIRKRSLPERKKVLSPIEEMEEMLILLQETPSNVEVEIKAYFSLISSLMKKFVSLLIQKDIDELTTSEIHIEIASNAAAVEFDEIISDVLQTCDLVKYAKFFPKEGIIKETTEKTKKIIRCYIDESGENK